jgi:hypothetical protein
MGLGSHQPMRNAGFMLMAELEFAVLNKAP